MCTGAGGIADELSENDRDEHFLKRYLQYSRSHCFPRISSEAAELLQAEYVSIRKQVRAALRPAHCRRCKHPQGCAADMRNSEHSSNLVNVRVGAPSARGYMAAMHCGAACR